MAREKGASHGDWVRGAYEILWETSASRVFEAGVPILIVVAAGGAGETKSIMRARDGVSGAATCEWLAAGLCACPPAIRRATRSAINRA